MPYVIPPVTRAEIPDAHDADREPADCPTCPSPVPHWPTDVCRSSFRRDEQGVERLFRIHCTCDGCY
ncbi:MAG TPA: hypothetical protein VGF17_22120 [Phytomonospora sp.]